MSKKIGAPSPSIALAADRSKTDSQDPLTTRVNTQLSLLNPKKALDLFLTSTGDETICAEVVESIVQKASQQHLSNHYDTLAEDYTAHAVWAEMLSVVGQSFVSNDTGMPRPVRSQVRKHLDAAAAWKPDPAPQRVSSDENSRRVMTIRNDYEPPVKDAEEDLCKTKTIEIPGKGRSKQARKSTIEGSLIPHGSFVGNQGSRPSSGSTSRQASSDDSGEKVNNASLSGPRAGVAARRVLQNVSLMKNLRQLTETTTSGTVPDIALETSSGTNVAHSSSRTHKPGQKNGDISPRDAKGLPAGKPPTGMAPLKQPESSMVAEELEVKQHQELIQRIHDHAEENSKKAAKISKALSDPKVSSKPYVVDANGQVIPVTSMELLMDSKAAPPAIEPPRYQLTSNVAPPPPVAAPVQAKKSGRPVETGAKTVKHPTSLGKSKDEQFYTTDTDEVPMNIQVNPVGGVGCKEANGPAKRAELKVPATKMQRSEYMKLVNAFESASAANTAPLGTDDFGNTLAKTVPSTDTASKRTEPDGSRPPTERLVGGSQTARVPTVPRRVGDKAPTSARKSLASASGSPVAHQNRPGSVPPTMEGVPTDDAFQSQNPALPPQRPKVTDTRPRPHFYPKPTHNATATMAALKASATWKDTSVKLSAVGVERVTVKHGLDGAEDAEKSDTVWV